MNEKVKFIARDIVMAEDPHKVMKVWRERLGVSQVVVARKMGVRPPSVADHESGRREPSVKWVKRYAEALVSAFEDKGKSISSMLSPPEGVLLGEFEEPYTARELCSKFEVQVLTGHKYLDAKIYGFTVLDALKAIMSVSGLEWFRTIGKSTERLFWFENVRGRGQSVAVAIRLALVKPRMVVLHGIKKPNEFAVRIMELEPLVFGVSDVRW